MLETRNGAGWHDSWTRIHTLGEFGVYVVEWLCYWLIDILIPINRMDSNGCN